MTNKRLMLSSEAEIKKDIVYVYQGYVFFKDNYYKQYYLQDSPVFEVLSRCEHSDIVNGEGIASPAEV